MNRTAIFSILVLLLLMAPPAVHAADMSLPYWGPLVTCSGAGQGTLPPCTGLCDVLETAQAIIYFALTLAIFGIIPIMIAVGGGMMMIGGGSKNLVEKGKKTLTSAIVGLVIVLGAFVILNTFVWLLTGTSGSWADIECSPGGIEGGLNP